VLTFAALTSASSASAATQHWASGHNAPYGKSQSFTGKALGSTVLTWKYGFGISIHVECSGMSSSGSIENSSNGSGGTLTSSNFELTKCHLEGSYAEQCKIENEAIKFEPLKARVYAESGKGYIEFSAASGPNLAVVQIENAYFGASCGLKGYGPLRGSFSIYTSPAQKSGQLILSSTLEGTNMTLWEYPLSGQGEFQFSTSTGEALHLGAESAHLWYVGSTEWNDLPTGESQSVSSGEALALTVKSKIFGGKFEVACSGSGDKLEGSVENQAGSGAAISSGTLSLGHCVMNGENGLRCSVQVATVPLSGVSAGTPAIVYSPTEGKKLMTLTIKQIAGGKTCNFVGSFGVTGKLAFTSLGEGLFQIAGSELLLGEEPTTAAGSTILETSSGSALRLQEL
jgi:hypothetical protein